MPKKKQQSKKQAAENIPSMFDNLEESFFDRPCTILPRPVKDHVYVKQFRHSND